MRKKNVNARCAADDPRRAEKQANAVRRRSAFLRSIDLPETTTGCVPCLSLHGDSLLEIENYSGILELTACMIRIYTRLGILRICGKDLLVRDADGEKLLIDGRIGSISFENN